jgi:phosphatidylserine/phosphatidylglycerophosphate/cardiolipin synthase-like enzyme
MIELIVRRMKPLHRLAWIVLVCLALAACATTQEPRAQVCPSGTQNLPDCPPVGAIDDPGINDLLDQRTLKSTSELAFDPVELGKNAEIPVQHALAKFLGPTDQAARESLAVKIWMIENAQHTVDFIYYIFKRDLIGYSFVAAMCDAVKRGVDVRVMIDGVGSFHSSHTELKALQSCANDAGFMRNDDGQLTTRKARVQVVVFNAMSKLLTNPNRRSHDKLLVADGHFPTKGAAITGGRNISTHYYGILEDGTADPDPFRDAEILVKSREQVEEDEITVGKVSEIYSSILMHFKDNKSLASISTDGAREIYRQELDKAYESLERLKSFELFAQYYNVMPDYWNEGFHDARVRLAHELGNLTDRKVTRDALGNQGRNPNSIMFLMSQISELRPDPDSFRIVSPYLFLARYEDKETGEVYDEAKSMREWLQRHPESTLEIVTNSVLTSDNFPAQSVIDMETAPRLLLTEQQQELWMAAAGPDEMSSEIVSSEEWKRIVNHPRVAVFETGRLDSKLLGEGDASYGKLHAKFFIEDEIGFIGTSNFDYRSRLYNNEMGFFFTSDGLAEEVHEGIDSLIASSYRWGTPEWFQLRQAVMQLKGMKGRSTRLQRRYYKFFRNTGFHWYL